MPVSGHASKRQRGAAMTSSPALVILYPERPDGDDFIERQVLGRSAEIRLRDVQALADLSEADRAGVTHLVVHALAAGAADIALFPDLCVVLRSGPARVAPIIEIRDISGHAIAERADQALALALALHRGLFGGIAPRRSASLTFGVLGLGPVGLAVALRAKAFGFRVVFHDLDAVPGIENGLGLARAASLQALLLKADILSLHTPDLPGLIGLAELAILPHGAIVVDTTGHATLDHAALASLLADGQIAAAGLDLPPDMPAPAGNVLVTRDTTHSPDALADLRRMIAEAAALDFNT